MQNTKFCQVFPNTKPIIGMIHLAGDKSEKIKRALDEIFIYEEEGLSGALIENYHGSVNDVINTLEAIKHLKQNQRIKLGINILPNEFQSAFPLTKLYDFLSFIQLDYVAGHYVRNPKINEESYEGYRNKYPRAIVFGGLYPKYYRPEKVDHERDFADAVSRCDALVVTGEATGKATPLDKIKQFREHIGDNFPLIVGAGMTSENAREQLAIANGAIVGSCLKIDNQTENTLDIKKIRDIMLAVNQK